MNADDYFRAALKYKIKKEGVKQKEINEYLNLPRTQLSAYLREASGFSENRKELLSEYFKMSFLEMLELGKNICEGNDPDKKESEKPEPTSKNDPIYLKELIKDMQWMIDIQREDVERKTEDIKDLREEIQDYKEEIKDLKKDLESLTRELEKAKIGTLKRDAS